jgi:hypothetical protein
VRIGDLLLVVVIALLLLFFLQRTAFGADLFFNLKADKR